MRDLLLRRLDSARQLEQARAAARQRLAPRVELFRLVHPHLRQPRALHHAKRRALLRAKVMQLGHQLVNPPLQFRALRVQLIHLRAQRRDLLLTVEGCGAQLVHLLGGGRVILLVAGAGRRRRQPLLARDGLIRVWLHRRHAPIRRGSPTSWQGCVPALARAWVQRAPIALILLGRRCAPAVHRDEESWGAAPEWGGGCE